MPAPSAVSRTPFSDAQAMAVEYSSTFEAPSAAELADIAVGDFVKICAAPERFWVEVESRQGDHFVGRIDNDLVRTDVHGLSCDQKVAFEGRHVYQIEKLMLKSAVSMN